MSFLLANPPSTPQPAGPYSQVGRVEFGDTTLIQLSGQISVVDGTLVGPNDIEAQTERIFVNIEALLGSQGATLANVINIRTYMTNMDLLRAYGKVRLLHFAGHLPTSTTVEVSRLFFPGALLEIEILAVIQERQG